MQPRRCMPLTGALNDEKCGIRSHCMVVGSVGLPQIHLREGVGNTAFAVECLDDSHSVPADGKSCRPKYLFCHNLYPVNHCDWGMIRRLDATVVVTNITCSNFWAAVCDFVLSEETAANPQICCDFSGTGQGWYRSEKFRKRHIDRNDFKCDTLPTHTSFWCVVLTCIGLTSENTPCGASPQLSCTANMRAINLQ